MHSPAEYWSSGAGLGNITPKGKPMPEGPGFPAFLRRLFGGETVVEFGCGIGRLAGGFDPQRYLGVDICPEAIRRAREAWPRHRFDQAGESGELPAGDAILAHTVLLHVPDDALAGTLARFGSRRIVIGEILGRHWRRDGDPPVFNRDMADYRVALPRHELRDVYLIAYPHYPGTSLTVMDFRWTRSQPT